MIVEADRRALHHRVASLQAQSERQAPDCKGFHVLGSGGRSAAATPATQEAAPARQRNITYTQTAAYLDAPEAPSGASSLLDQAVAHVVSNLHELDPELCTPVASRPARALSRHEAATPALPATACLSRSGVLGEQRNGPGGHARRSGGDFGRSPPPHRAWRGRRRRPSSCAADDERFVTFLWPRTRPLDFNC